MLIHNTAFPPQKEMTTKVIHNTTFPPKKKKKENKPKKKSLFQVLTKVFFLKLSFSHKFNFSTGFLILVERLRVSPSVGTGEPPVGSVFSCSCVGKPLVTSVFSVSGSGLSSCTSCVQSSGSNTFCETRK